MKLWEAVEAATDDTKHWILSSTVPYPECEKDPRAKYGTACGRIVLARNTCIGPNDLTLCPDCALWEQTRHIPNLHRLKVLKLAE